MYRILFITFFLLITEYSFSQSFSYNKGGTKATNYFEEIPYQDINGKMIVKVKINGIDYNFLFDTGAPMCLSSKILTAVNADKLENDQVKDVNGNKTSSSTVIIKDIALGNLNFSGIPAVVGVPDFFKCWNVEGIIGSNLLRNSIIQINSQKKTIIITDLTEKLQLGDNKGISLFLDTIQSYPVFKVQLSGNSTMKVNFDTGDNGLLSLSETSMEQLKKAKVYEIVTKGYGANQIGAFGMEKDNEKLLLKFLTFNIADVHLKNVMTVTSKGSGARLGSKMLNYAIVTIDFINKKFYFEGNAKEIDLAEKQWPFQPTFNNNKLIVGLVWDEASDSVALGEQIVEVDGIRFETVDFCDLLNKKSILEGKERSIITLRSQDGKLRKLEVEKK
ncbi:clan AA aspartic protease [Pedobacter sp. MR2016-19]|uniref:retropepsin-like aspartic protease n=1 Tax=Pedobacter sp. MR2016-19 TaxID=2780089 RepID=UPI0018751DEF|nr:retropepsin-like aspartic protease [Pedobacter sp. MR2016-19]MBE5320074.1 clan AA aspartic protease [Pedobacter sp. MR2016-19]